MGCDGSKAAAVAEPEDAPPADAETIEAVKADAKHVARPDEVEVRAVRASETPQGTRDRIPTDDVVVSATGDAVVVRPPSATRSPSASSAVAPAALAPTADGAPGAADAPAAPAEAPAPVPVDEALVGGTSPLVSAPAAGAGAAADIDPEVAAQRAEHESRKDRAIKRDLSAYSRAAAPGARGKGRGRGRGRGSAGGFGGSAAVGDLQAMPTAAATAGDDADEVDDGEGAGEGAAAKEAPPA
jgi:hypothetical protein